MPQDIRDAVTTGGTPGAPNHSLPARAGERATVRGNPAREYIAGGYTEWYQNLARVLPWPIDDITEDFGADLYERMLLDAQVASVLGVLRTGVLEDGATLTPAIDDSDDPQYQQASQIVTFCEEVLDNLDGTASFDDILEDMLLALALGNRVAEITYTDDLRSIRAIKVKPRQSTAFVVDAYRNVIGLLGLIPGVALPVQQGMFIIDVASQPNILPREKFFVFSNRPIDNDPRGQSLLRPAYDAWNQKTQLAAEYLKYLTQFASPTLKGTTSPDSIADAVTDGLGNLQLDGNGNPVQVTPEQALLNALMAVRNGTAIVAPPGATIDPIEMQGNGEAFVTAFDRFDRQITKAILYQTLSTEEAEHGTRAQAGVHQDTLDTVKRQRKKALQRALRRDVLIPLVRYNFGDDAARRAPRVSLGVAETPDTAGLVTAFATAGYTVEPEQFPELDEMAGLPVRPPEALQRTVNAAELGVQGQEASVQQQQQPVTTPQPQGDGSRGQRSSQPNTDATGG